MKISIFTVLCLVAFSSLSTAQNQNKQQADTTKVSNLDEVLVSSTRAHEKTPMAHSTLTKAEIKKRNLGQDIPTLLNYMPSVVTTTDAGNGVGYSGIRVRGSDATRVNVTINGIPYNDSESQGTFWVNLPDFASSTENIQLQRGVGTSTNGSGAFGASLNILTDAMVKTPSGSIANSFGSYNTHKHTLKFSTGILSDVFELSGRISKINSDGYVDRASSDLNSYFFQGSFSQKNTLIKALVFGGTQQTYQAWNGIEDLDILRTNRTFNPSGLYYDDLGNPHFYKNEIDHYKQDHYQLHWSEKWLPSFTTNLALHYTKGFGYYENYKQNASLSDYNLISTTLSETDLVRQKILDNHLYGLTFSGNYIKDKWNIVLGGAANQYIGDHIGKVIWTKQAEMQHPNHTYYFNTSKKSEFNTYGKLNYELNPKLNLYVDLQYRFINYKANAEQTGNINQNFNFFNPKAGINYELNNANALYISYAKAQREPNRNDYENGSPKPEKLDDYELGWRYKTPKTQLNANVYYMLYKDQLVVTGALNEVGYPIRENIGDSYRLGLEVDANIQILPKLFVNPSLTISQNKNKSYRALWDGNMQNLGNTNIAFSPNVVASNAITYIPLNSFQVSLLTKYVGEQYMGNTDTQKSKLKAYYVNDININYTWYPKAWVKSVQFSALLNNIFNVKYISNGYYYTYDDTWSQPQTKTIEGAGYYPQATFNFLAGVTLNF